MRHAVSVGRPFGRIGPALDVGRAGADEPTPSGSAAPSGEPIAADPPPLALEEVATGLDAPINITVTPDGWLLVNERIGRVIAVDPESGSTEVALDITDRVLEGFEQGLLGLALHPDWPDDPRAYVHYSSREGDGDTVLSEFRVTDDTLPPRLDPTTERVLLTVDQPYANHNGGQLAFGPDGLLYMGLGDGGSGGDPHGNGQNPDVLLGKILRIDVDDEEMPTPSRPRIPSRMAGARRRSLLIGLRNPWRFSFDRETGLLWIGDVGQNAAEEIDRIDPVADAGANLGWNVMEGSQCFSTADLLDRRADPPRGRIRPRSRVLGHRRLRLPRRRRSTTCAAGISSATTAPARSSGSPPTPRASSARARCSTSASASAPSARVPTASSTSPISAVARSTGSSPATDRASRARAGSSIDRGR